MSELEPRGEGIFRKSIKLARWILAGIIFKA